MAAVTHFATVQKIYIAFYQRPADPAGLQYWAQRIDGAGGSASAVVAAFAESAESIALYGAITKDNIGGVIDKIYLALFNRAPDAAGKQFYVDGFAAGTFTAGSIALAVLDGAAGDDRVAINNKAQVANEFTQQVDGRTFSDPYFGTGSASTFKATYSGDADAVAARTILKAVTSSPATVLNPSQVTEEIKTKIADAGDTILGQTGGQTFMLTAGLDNITGTAGNDTFNADHALLSASDVISGGLGIDTLNYTDSGTAGGNVPAAQISGVEIINVRNVNGSPAVAATKENVTLSFNAVVGGTTALSLGSLSLNGASTVTKEFASGESLSGADLASYFAVNLPTDYEFVSLNGAQLVIRAKAAGLTDDLTTTYTAGTGGTPSGSAPATVITQGVAAIDSTGVLDTVVASNFAGATDFNSNLSTNAVTFTGLATGQKVGVIGNGSIATKALSFAYATPTDAVTVNVAGGTKDGSTITNTGAGATAVTINSTGAANTVGAVQLAAGATVKTLAVNAATNLTMGAVTNLATDAAVTVAGAAASVSFGTTALAAAKTIDASGLTAGGVTVGLATVATSFKGGQGNDVVTTAAIASTASIDAGAGTADVLAANADTDVDTAPETALYKNFEVLRTAADTSKTYDMSLFTASAIGAVQVSTATSQTISKMTAAQAGNITVRGDQGSALTVTLADATGAADVVGLTLSNPTATATAPADVDVAGFSIAGVETLNITSSGGGVDLANAGTLNSLAFGAGGANKLKTIAVAGASSLDLSLANTDVAVTVTSAQTGTGSLKVAGNVIKGSSVTTTANKDDITVTAQAAGGASDFITYNAGAGDDAISASVAAINNVDSTKASVKIDGGAGIDTLTISGGGANMVDANFQFLTGTEKLTVGADGAVDIKTGGFFDTNFKATGIELTADVSATNGDTISVDMATFAGNVKATLTNATDSATTITTGSGVDTIKVTNAGVATSDTITVAAGAGADTININSKATGASNVIVVTGGQGADTINLAETARGTVSVHNQAKLNIAAADSTVAAADSITGFRLADGTNLSDNLNLDSFQKAGAQTAAAVTGFTGAELTYSIDVTTAKLTFVGSKAAALTATQVADLAVQLVTAAEGDSVFFISGNDAYVFNNAAAGDTLVKLVGLGGTTDTLVGLTGTAGTTTDGYLYIG